MTVTADRTFTPDTLQAAERPTFYFIGVTTAASSIRSVFPAWAEHLNLGDVDFVGIDLPLHAPQDDYRRVVSFLRDDRLSRGALVTSHKLDLFAAAHDLFDEIDPLAQLTDETSCISKRDGQLHAHAKDPITAGLALSAIAGETTLSGREILIFGAGGSATALTWHLLTQLDHGSSPASITVTDVSPERCEAFLGAVRSFAPDRLPTLQLVRNTAESDALLASLQAGAVVINATGLGKDRPGSPISDEAQFPQDALVWELNYRGDLKFLSQARAQAFRGVEAHDGWIYFVHGWTSVIAEVFDIPIPRSGPEFEVISTIAAEARG